MPRYIAIHPQACTERDLRRLVERHDEMPEDTLWNRSWCGVNEPVAFCDWEAVDEQAVAEVFGAFGVPYSSIHRVTYFRGDAADTLASDAPACAAGTAARGASSPCIPRRSRRSRSSGSSAGGARSSP